MIIIMIIIIFNHGIRLIINGPSVLFVWVRTWGSYAGDGVPDSTISCGGH